MSLFKRRARDVSAREKNFAFKKRNEDVQAQRENRGIYCRNACYAQSVFRPSEHRRGSPTKAVIFKFNCRRCR